MPAGTYCTETVGTSKQQQRRMHVSDDYWIRRIAGINIVDRSRMKDLRK